MRRSGLTKVEAGSGFRVASTATRECFLGDALSGISSGIVLDLGELVVLFVRDTIFWEEEP